MRVLTSSLIAAALLVGCSSSDSNGAGDGGPMTESDGGFDGGPMGSDDGSIGDGSTSCASDDPSCMADGSMPGADEDAGEAICPTVRFESTVTITDLPGNVLLVFDRSGTMGLDWEGQQRATAAAGAVDRALGPIADTLTVGALFFPTVDPKAAPPADGQPVCTVGAIGDEAQIEFMPGDDFLTAFAAGSASDKIYAPLAAGGTPLLDALKEADVALTDANLDGITTIVLITDGAPNCGWDEGAAKAIVEGWLAAGRLTYVVGLPGVSGAEATLNGLAVAGGTHKFFSPDAADALEPVLAAIAQQTVRTGLASCDVELKPAAEQPDRLTMIVEDDGKEQEVDRDLGNSGGWSVNTAGTMVTLEGALCKAAQIGLYDAIRFEYRCDTEPDLPTAPPPTVPVGPPEPPEPILF